MAQLPSKGTGAGYRRDHRVSFVLRDGEQLLPCPYDKCHFLLPNKLLIHLTKCRGNYLKAIEDGKKKVLPEDQLVICRHTFLHHVPQGSLKEHEETCPKNPNTDEKRNFAKLLERDQKIKREEHEEAYNKSAISGSTFGVIPGGKGDPGSGAYGKTSGPGFWDVDSEEIQQPRRKKQKTETPDPSYTPKSNDRLLDYAEERDPETNWDLVLK